MLAQTENIRTDSPNSGGVAPAAPGERVAGAKIMIVDDDVHEIEVIQAHLQKDRYQHVIGMDNPASALWDIFVEQPDVLLLDLRMPQINGIDLLKGIRRDQRTIHMPVIVLTAISNDDEKLQALELGATDFLHKPIHGAELRVRLRNILISKAFRDQLQDQSAMLEQAVRQRTWELDYSRREVIHCLARAAEFRDNDTGQHVLRVGRYARIIGAELGLDKGTLDVLEQAAQLHDIGKIGIPDEILLKPGKLTPDEFEVMKRHCSFGKQVARPFLEEDAASVRQHTEFGAQILEAGQSPILKCAMRIALTHHEWWDGTGYPLSLAGEDIPLEGRITAVADVFDALSNKRPYKPAYPLDECISILNERRDSQFDPRVLDAFMSRRQEIVQTQIDYAEC